MAADADGVVDAALDALPCGVVSFDDDGRVLAANAALHELLGYPSGELRGAHVDRLLTASGRVFYQTHLFPLLRLHGKARELFLLLCRRDGSEVGALVSGVRRAGAGGAAVSECVLFEVRERRKYEQELLRARHAAEEASAELTAVNERLRRQAVALEAQQARLEAQAADLDRQRRELEAANDALRARSDELELARAAAEGANHAKSQFLTTMSHELRTPLNAIGGYAQLMELGIHGPVTEAQRDALARITRSQRHLLRLVNDVLNLARIEAGRVDYAVEAVPVADVVASVTPMLEPQMAAAGLAFTAAVDPGLVARADRDKVQQVLLNLLTNAMKFTPAGGRATLDAAADGSGERVVVRVRDTGVGVRRDMLESIFEPFVQVDASHTRTAEGTGLGLAISRDLARGMGGDLTAESTLGAGSVFTLTLPRA